MISGKKTGFRPFNTTG